MGVMAALQPTRRGLGRLPRITGEEARFPGHEGELPAGPYGTVPEEEDEMVEVWPGVFLPKSVVERMAPEQRQIEPAGEIPQLPEPAYPMPQEEIEAGRRELAPRHFPKEPSRLGKGLRAVAGGLLSALPGAIEAAATPNIAGGGGTDVMRALQAAGRYQSGRDMLTHEMARKEREQRRLEMSAAAQAESDRARAEVEHEHARLFREQAAAARRGKPKDEYMSVGSGGLFNLTLGAWVREPEKKVEPVVDGLLRELSDPRTPEARQTRIRSAMEARYGHGAAQERNPTEASLALLAASGDEVAQRALGLLQAQGGGPDERQKKARVTSAWQRYFDDLNQAETQFSAGKARLDQPGTRPGSKHPTSMMPSQLTWEDYNNQLYDLETALQTKKNNASHGLETVLDEFEVPYQRRAYGHPSTQRRAGAGSAGQAAPATAPTATPATPAAPQAAQGMGQDLVGKTVRLNDGRRVVVRKVNPDGTFEY